MSKIHIVDIVRVGLNAANPTSASFLEVGKEMVTAFKRTGFAYLQHHGVPEALQSESFAVSQQFFALSTEKKMMYERFVKTGFNGYTPIGGENTGKLRSMEHILDYKECYDLHICGEDYPEAVVPEFGPQLERLGHACCRLASRLLESLQMALAAEISADTSATCANPATPHSRLTNGPKSTQHITNHPEDGTSKETALPSLSSGTAKITAEDEEEPLANNASSTERIRTGLRGLVTTGLRGLGDHRLTDGHQRMLRMDGCSALRVLNYPAVPHHIPAGTVRCAAHTDYGTMTLLFQDQLGGLQIQTRDGAWIDATPVPGTILVNIGDLMETWSSGRLRATTHRVVIPSDGKLRRRARQSVAMFVQPDAEVTVLPLDGSTAWPPQNPGEQLRGKFAATYPAFASK